MATPLSWAAFAMIAAGVVAGGLAKVNLHDPSAILAAVTAIAPALAGLCMHPPWAQSDAPPAASEEHKE